MAADGGMVDIAIRVQADAQGALIMSRSLDDVAKSASAATSRLEMMAAKGNDVQVAALRLRQQMQEITALRNESGQVALAQQAAAKAQAEFSAVVAKANAPTRTLTESVELGAAAATKAKGSYGNLARQLGDVGTMAAMGASPIQILITQGEQIAFALGEAWLTAGKFAAALPIIGTAAAYGAVIIAGLATAYVVYQNHVSDATDATAIVTERIREAGEAAAQLGTTLSETAASGWADMLDSARDTTTELRILTGEITKQDAEIAKLQAGLKEQAAPAMLELGKRSVELSRALEQAHEQVRTQSEGWVEAIAVEQRLRPQLEAVNAELARRKAALAEATENARVLTVATDAQAAADDRAKAAAEAAAKAKREAAAAERERIDSLREIIDWQDRLAEQDRRLAEEAVRTAQERADGIAEALREEMAWQERIAAQEAATARQQAYAPAGVVSAVSGGASGLLSAIGQAGPYGALISAILSLLENLDETLQGVVDFVGNIIEQVGQLPSTIADFVGSILSEAAPALIEAIGDLLGGLGGMVEEIVMSLSEALPDLLVALIDLLIGQLPRIIVDLVGSLTDPALWIEAGKAMFDGFVEGISGLGGLMEGDTSATSIGDALTGGMVSNIGGLFNGSYASGTDRTTREGLYYLHRDEEVRNRARTAQADKAEAAMGRGRMMGSGGRVYIEVDAGSLSQSMTAMGRRGYSFGGG